MNFKRFVAASSSIVVFALAWNGLVHMVILREADAVLNTIGRPASDRSLVLSLLVTLVLALVFVWSYTRYAHRGTLREGLSHGLFFGILAGILVDLNQYVLYPIPASLAFLWCAFGIIEFCIYGVIVSRIYRNAFTTELPHKNMSK